MTHFTIFGKSFLAGLLVAWPLQAAAQQFPSAGACNNGQGRAVIFDGASASIYAFGEKYTGRVVGMRPHDNGFKFSIFYEDTIGGESEIVIFSLPEMNPDHRYRMGVVSYETVGGVRLASVIEPFDVVGCLLQ